MDIQFRPLESVVPFHTDIIANTPLVESVAQLIRESERPLPLVIDPDGVIVLGHARWMANKHLGRSQVPVYVVPDATPERLHDARVRDRASALCSQLNLDVLSLGLRVHNDVLAGLEMMEFLEGCTDRSERAERLSNHSS